MRLAVRVTPRGGRDAVDGWARDEAGRPVLRVRVAAVVALLSKALGVPKSAIAITRGHTARLKQIEVADLDPSGLAGAFGEPRN